MYAAPHAFISHTFFYNPFTIIVLQGRRLLRGLLYVSIDSFICNRHNPGCDLRKGLTMKATIEASGLLVLVCLDKDTLPLSHMWCLYEIGSAPIEKLVLLTHGFDSLELGRAYGRSTPPPPTAGNSLTRT